MTREALKSRVLAAVDRRAGEIVTRGARLLAVPELGFREERTAAVVEGAFAAMGLPYRPGLALTGLRADGPGTARPRVAVLGELDALPCLDSPYTDPLTGAAHICGHHTQLAVMLGVAQALVDADAFGPLGGSVAFFAVPAEEMVELEYRLSLREQGKIGFITGKAELLRLGCFDDVDLALIVHAWSETAGRRATVGVSYNGVVTKEVIFRGRKAHAGASPHHGINALTAANLAWTAIQAQRETFREEDTVRVHGIVTHGGAAINIIPDLARLELMVRARTLEALAAANAKVNRALRAGGLALGARVEIRDVPGYLPFQPYGPLDEVVARNFAALLGPEQVQAGGHRTASTDAGDLSHVMPVAHPLVGGFEGGVHTAGFRAVDPEMAYVMPTRALAGAVVELLAGGAEQAQAVLAGWQPRLTAQAYRDYMARAFQEQAWDEEGRCGLG